MRSLPVSSQEELDDARQALPEAVFKELYLCEPSDDGGNPFGLKFIRQNIAPLSNKAPVAFGSDLARSVDWTVLHGLDEDGATCSLTRFLTLHAAVALNPARTAHGRVRLTCISRRVLFS